MKLPKHYWVTCHTDTVGKGSTFVAIKGAKYDGAIFIKQALQKGATRIVVQKDIILQEGLQDIIEQHGAELLRVDNTRKALALLSAQAYGYPARKLKIFGITGTKGKTSSVFLLEHILHTAGRKTALLSTVYNHINGQRFESTFTTPQADYLHMFFDMCVKAGVTHVAMEVAAQALSMERVVGLEFSGIIFTNFSHEHGEFYASQDEYFAAKQLLFAQYSQGAPVVVNADDPKGQVLLANNDIFIGYTLCNEPVLYKFNVLGSVATAVELEYIAICGALCVIKCPLLLGMFNAYNVAGVISLCIQLGVEHSVLAQACTTFTGIPGRLEQYFLPNGARCFIDYAHNPDSYEKVLSLLRAMTDDLIVVFGAGGQRDRAKRPIMGSIAYNYADYIVLTADNPRTENLDVIMDDICEQFVDTVGKVHRVHDRVRAIELACRKSQSGSIVVILGKGSDEYQIIGTTKNFFSDRQIVQDYQFSI